MSKKIKLKIKDVEKLEFFLDEDATKGDYVSLTELEQVSFDSLKNEIKSNEKRLFDEHWEDNKDSYIRNSEEFREIQDKIESQKIANDNEKRNLENELIEYKSKIESINRENELKIDSAVNNEASKFKDVQYRLESEIKDLKYQIENQENKKESDLARLELKMNTEFNELIREKENIINELEQRKSSLNIKNIGEDLERWITTEASNGLSLPNTKFTKANKVIEGTKPDFIFEILNDDDSILSSVTLEAKSELLNGKTKTKNSDHYEKLESDRKKNNTEYSLLVSELEKEDAFLFKKVGEYKNMYVVRPQFFVSFLQIIYNLEMKKNEFVGTEINFKEKQEILREFEDFKTDFIEVTMLKLVKNYEDIVAEAGKIIANANKIIEKTRTSTSHLTALENKLNKFKIEKVLSKMD